MKKLNVILVIATLFLASCSMFSGAETYKLVKYDTSIHCDGCKDTVMENLPHADGVVEISVDVATKVIAVTFDPSETNENKLAEFINEIGYSAKVISVTDVKG